MKDYLDSIVRPLLGSPEELSIKESTDELGVLLVVNVSKDDMGHVIGKEGNNILSIRKLIGMYGMRHNAKISVKINEPIGGRYYVSGAAPKAIGTDQLDPE